VRKVGPEIEKLPQRCFSKLLTYGPAWNVVGSSAIEEGEVALKIGRGLSQETPGWSQLESELLSQQERFPPCGKGLGHRDLIGEVVAVGVLVNDQ
jgi:hypothetical protein